MEAFMVKCLECNKEFKSQLTSHLPVHGMNKESYLQKYPNATTIGENLIKKFQGRQAWNKGGDDPRILKGENHPMFGKKHSEKSKKQNSQTHLNLYKEDKNYKQRVSEGTKKGMRKPELWKKYQDYIKSRDITGENNPFYGKHHTEENKQKISNNKERAEKISKNRKQWWSGNKGKTVEELYGEEVGKKIREIKSEQTRGENNPAYGKVYENTGGKIGRYKGLLFRGIWEYSFWKYLENQGFDIHNKDEVEYGPFRIKYIRESINRTYTPDFLIKGEKKLIEVKSEYKRSKESDVLALKKQAAEKWCEENGYIYQILTEKDFPVLTYSQAYADENIEWIRK